LNQPHAFDKKRYWVTGSSSGIGAAVVDALLFAKGEVVGIARRAQKPRDGFYSESVDLGALEMLPAKLEDLLCRHGVPHGAILCAGRGDFGSLEEFSTRRIRDLIDVNFTATALVLRALLPALKRERRGDLIVIGSEAALDAGRKGALYSATKFALRGLVLALRKECARSGLRIGLINPGMVATPFFDGLDFGPGEQSDEHLLAEDVAEQVLHMLSARSGVLVDEVNLSPLKKVVRKRKNGDGGASGS
jgi:3-hydroxy acid dehydrogenase/malonic semialdehyde reductase